MKIKPEKRWIIWDEYIGFYVGAELTRRDAIAQHIHNRGRTWKECFKSGDRAIHVQIVPLKAKNG